MKILCQIVPRKSVFKELVDIPRLQELTDELYKATGIPSAIISIDGEVITGSGWQQICTDFHREHPHIEKECMESDIRIRQHLDEGEPFVIYRCPRGLVDASSPVIIDNEHVANVFAGQLFTNPPEEAQEEFFRQQARKFGLDEENYMKAYRKIPVLAEEKFRPALSFLAKFAQMIANTGLARKRELNALQDLRINETKYRRLLESTNTVPWELDLSTKKFTYMGLQAEKIFGYTLSYWKDMDSWASLVHDDDREWAMSFREFENRSDHDLEYRMITKDGRELWIQDVVTVICGAKGPERLVGFMHNITDRKRAEEELRESEEKYRNILENIEDGYFEVDLAGNFTFFNSSHCRIFGYPREEIQGVNYRVFIDAENAKKVFRTFNEVYVTGIPRKGFEWETIRKDGARTYIEVSVSLIARPGEKPTGFRGIARDVTERKKAEEALRQAEENFRRSLDESPLGVRIVTEEGETVYANRAILDMHGYDSIEEYKTAPVEKRYTPESYAEFKIRRDKRRQGVDLQFEYAINIIRKNGEVRHLQVFRKEILWDGKRHFK